MNLYQIYDLNAEVLWRRAVEQFPAADLFYQPEYGLIFQEEGMGRACLFYGENSGGFVLYPFFLRRINDLPDFSGRLVENYYDITSPYGYAGPVLTGPNKTELFRYFQQSFGEYCQENKIVSEFIRFHPLLDNHSYPWPAEMKVEKARSIVVVDLTLSEAGLWAGYKYNNRKNINRADREGLQVTIEETPDHFPEFLRIYRATMDRREAKSRYYFSDRFFLNIHRYLKGRYSYAYVFKDREIISAELLLSCYGYLHSFLGGTLAQYFYCRPNNLLKHRVILRAREQGRKYFILGGGYEENDGIFQYKLSFAPQGVRDFYVGKKILDPEAAACLDRMKNYPGALPGKENKFFPSYREE